MKFKKISAVLAGTLLALSAALPAFAANSNSNPQFGVMLSSIDGMKNANDSNWDLTVSAGQTLHGSVSVQNVSDKAATFNLSFEQGFTNDSVVVGYASGNNTKSLTDNMNLKKIGSLVKSTVTVPANSTTTVPVTLQMSDQSFDGTVLGALVVTKQVSKAEKAESNFVNQFTYVKGVRLTESDATVVPELTNTKRGKVTVASNRQIFNLPIVNDKAAVISDMAIKTKITKKSTGETVLTDKQSARQVAPNSKFTYQLPSNKVLEAGKYNYDVLMTDQNTGRHWRFTGEFTITQSMVGQIKAARTLAQIPMWVWFLVAILFFLIFLLLFLLFKRRKKDEEDETEVAE